MANESEQSEERRRPLNRPTANQLREERAQILVWAGAFAKAGQSEVEELLLSAADTLRSAEKALSEKQTTSTE